MKMYQVCMARRNALGLTQKEVADLAGISASTVANFENGKEVSTIVFKTIVRAIDDYMRRLDKKEFMIAQLHTMSLQLEYEDDAERATTLTYISLYAAKLQLEIMQTQTEY